jgi:DNA polymerase III delta prime subunit
MKLSEAYKIVKGCMSQKVPVMLWGPPGIGKSSLIHQISKELGCRVVDLRLAQLEPTDLRGVPMPNRETGRAEWYLPAFWPTSATQETTRKVTDADGKTHSVTVAVGDCLDGPGVIFLDEIEKAPVSVKNASLQLVLDRMVGSYKLPNDWSIVCAGNREEDGCFSQPLGSALSNRMIHLDIESDVDAWGTWARDNDVSEDVIAFLHFNPSLLYKQTEEHAFPTPRSWVLASSLIKNVKAQRDQKELMTAAVGRGAASEFTVWNNVYRSVDPEKILEEGVMPSFEKSDQSYKYAVGLSTAFYLRKRKGGIKKVEENVANFLGLLPIELRVVFLKQISLQTMESMAKHPAFKQYVSSIMKIVV